MPKQGVIMGSIGGLAPCLFDSQIPVLERVRVQNFRCLRDVTLELGPFTVFVGPNASGKSAIADALTLHTADLYSEISHDMYKSGYATYQVIVDEHSIPNKRYWWQGEKRPNWTVLNQSGFPDNVLEGDRFKYSFVLNELRQLQEADEAWTLTATGSNLANLFNTLARNEQEQFVKDFVRMIPMYSDIKARTIKGKVRLQFLDRWHKDFWYEPIQVSDGTLLTSAIVAVAYQSACPNLAVIEDPDRALHPYLQRHVVEMLRKLSVGKIGHGPIQVVCTTHSQSFLNCLEPEEVRFIRRNRETGETEVQKAPTDNPNWQNVYDQFQNSLGSMWLTGTLGGVPGI